MVQAIETAMSGVRAEQAAPHCPAHSQACARRPFRPADGRVPRRPSLWARPTSRRCSCILPCYWQRSYHEPQPQRRQRHARQEDGARAALAGAGGRGGLRQGLHRGANTRKLPRRSRVSGRPAELLPPPCAQGHRQHQGRDGQGDQGARRHRVQIWDDIKSMFDAMVARDGLEVLKADAMAEVREAAANITLEPAPRQGLSRAAPRRSPCSGSTRTACPASAGTTT